jgi:hypothetical protein
LSRPRERNHLKSPSNYHLGYFTLWWVRMEREERKIAEDRRNKAEDEADEAEG